MSGGSSTLAGGRENGRACVRAGKRARRRAGAFPGAHQLTWRRQRWPRSRSRPRRQQSPNVAGRPRAARRYPMRRAPLLGVQGAGALRYPIRQSVQSQPTPIPWTWLWACSTVRLVLQLVLQQWWPRIELPQQLNFISKHLFRKVGERRLERSSKYLAKKSLETQRQIQKRGIEN